MAGDLSPGQNLPDIEISIQNCNCAGDIPGEATTLDYFLTSSRGPAHHSLAEGVTPCMCTTLHSTGDSRSSGLLRSGL